MPSLQAFAEGQTDRATGPTTADDEMPPLTGKSPTGEGAPADSDEQDSDTTDEVDE